jgi:hypothetical protein
MSMSIESQSKAGSVARAAIESAEKYEGLLSGKLQRAVALAEVSKWASAQDATVSDSHVGYIVREAADLVIAAFAAGGVA